MTIRELVALLSGSPIGTLTSDRNGKLGFAYVDKARTARDAVPLSLSLPLAQRVHPHDAVEAFLWGLLPDNENVLSRWAREFQVSSRSPFALLAHVGEDCAGAVQIAPPERVPQIEGPGPIRVNWLTESQVAERLRELRGDETAWSRADDEGRFSLAGAQPKIALFQQRGRWGIPVGRTPTTHILKPSTGVLHGQIENEHFCLHLARALGFPVAHSSIVRFGDEVAIASERYDRVRLDETLHVQRLHQEDMCQALGIRPHAKYQNEGGPSPEQIAELLREHSDEPEQDIDTFRDALLFNWLIAGSDGHAKNYSILHGGGARVRLAPLYDLASALPYPSLNTPRLKLAMKIGGHYRLQEIGSRELRKLAKGMRQDEAATLERARELSVQLPRAAEEVVDACRRDGLDHSLLDELATRLSERARQCRERLA